MTVFFDRICHGPDHLLISWIRRNIGKVFGESLTGYREAVTVQQARLKQGFHKRLNTADLD